MNVLTWAAVAGGSMLAAAGVGATELVAKQLAGPPSEFASQRPPDPAAAAILSKSALLAVEFAAGKDGLGHWSGQLPVDGGRARLVLLAAAGEHWDLQLGSPDGGHRRSAQALAKTIKSLPFGLGAEQYPATYYAFDQLRDGRWQLQLKAAAGSRGGFVLLEGDARSQLSSHQGHRDQRVGVGQQIVSQLTFEEFDGAIKLGAAAGVIERASLRVRAPDGRLNVLPMFDDGQHGDGTAGDGVYGADFLADQAGSWQAQVLVEGYDPLGRPLLRSAEHLIPIVDDGLELAAERAKAVTVGGGRLQLQLPVTASKAVGPVRAYAEVWGYDDAGREQPVAWIGGMVEALNGTVELGLDPRWLGRSKAVAGYHLRQLRLEDSAHFVTLASRDRLALDLPLGIRPKAFFGEPDEAMRMGVRPTALELAADKGVGSRLLLVHGYCSGDVWPSGHFSNASKFLDLNQNRSHDQFARLIQSFGNSWNSFGIVAHSQGGAAALHLYTYYWSGLDNASGNRLIQSVGTPYRGTNLAGILASLGSWFGVGCGSNDNLSYSGASAWLAGIPSWARAKVNYYTTSFRSTNWWTNDYCNIATDLVLSDPEDGTTEQVYGQLSGAVNRGHASGQCHTTGMRDPAQYQDASRNATMNSNAAR